MTTDNERAYIAAMSRPSVVAAYQGWSELSREESLIVALFVPEGARVLDLGCGTGRLVPFLHERRCEYLGVDASLEMIDAARKEHDKARFHIGNIVDFDYHAGDFDVVLLMHNVIDSLQPYIRRKEFLEACQRRLADGVLILSSHTSESDPGYVGEDYHGVHVENFRASHGWHVSNLESLGFQVLLSIECERNGTYDWSYFVARRRDRSG